jgi:hypothetical protein
MDLPLIVSRKLCRLLVKQAYEEGRLDQVREDVRTLNRARKEVSAPTGALLREQDLDDLANSGRVR